MPNNNIIDKRNSNIQIYINGSFYLRDDAKISVFDSGFLLGDGIWEGIRLVKNEWLFIDEHIDRLFEGCHAVDITLDLSRDEIKEAILETQKINNMTDSAHARVMITRGDKIKPFQQPSLSTPGINFIIIMEHSSESPNSNGIKLVTVPQAGGAEALMLDPYGFVNTTNSCNFFIVKNNEVWTSTGDYCMNGITRKKVIELCSEHKIPIYEKNFSLVDVYSAQEAFITGTLGSLTQVISIDERSIGSSDDGWPITSKLRQAYKKLINV